MLKNGLFLSPSASAMPHPHRFLGNSALWWDLKNDVTISTPWYLGLVFRTRVREGTLLQAQAGQYTSLLFQVRTHTLMNSNATHLCYILARQTMAETVVVSHRGLWYLKDHVSHQPVDSCFKEAPPTPSLTGGFSFWLCWRG